MRVSVIDLQLTESQGYKNLLRNPAVNIKCQGIMGLGMIKIQLHPSSL